MNFHKLLPTSHSTSTLTGASSALKDSKTQRQSEMAGPPSSAAMKQRIISHMNADHPDSLEDYLKFYNGINGVLPGSAKLLDLSLDSLLIEYSVPDSPSAKTSTVKITPAMSSYAESRTKLVAMAEEATGKQFHVPPDPPSPSAPIAQSSATASVSTGKEIGWTVPGLLGFITSAGICFGYWALSQEGPLAVGGPLEKYLPGIVVELARRFREQLFAMMIGIHLVEALFAANKCIENGVAFPYLVLWTLNTAIEGGPAIARLNQQIKKNQR